MDSDKDDVLAFAMFPNDQPRVPPCHGTARRRPKSESLQHG